MYVVMIPLGVLVDTKVERAIEGFGAMIHSYSLGVKLDDAFLQELQTTFKRYSLGGYESEDAFANDLLAALKAKIPAHRRETIRELERDWPYMWRGLWNSQCNVPADITDMMPNIRHATMARNVKWIVISETNPTHYAFIRAEINRLARVDSDYPMPIALFNDKDAFLLSFEHRKPTEVMMADYLEANKDKFEKCIRIQGNVDFIANPVFHQLAVEKEQRIVAATSKYNVEVVQLSTARLDSQQLEQIIKNNIPTPEELHQQKTKSANRFT